MFRVFAIVWPLNVFEQSAPRSFALSIKWCSSFPFADYFQTILPSLPTFCFLNETCNPLNLVGPTNDGVWSRMTMWMSYWFGMGPWINPRVCTRITFIFRYWIPAWSHKNDRRGGGGEEESAVQDSYLSEAFISRIKYKYKYMYMYMKVKYLIKTRPGTRSRILRYMGQSRAATPWIEFCFVLGF